jgi:hypothetical protein
VRNLYKGVPPPDVVDLGETFAATGVRDGYGQRLRGESRHGPFRRKEFTILLLNGPSL